MKLFVLRKEIEDRDIYPDGKRTEVIFFKIIFRENDLVAGYDPEIALEGEEGVVFVCYPPAFGEFLICDCGKGLEIGSCHYEIHVIIPGDHPLFAHCSEKSA